MDLTTSNSPSPSPSPSPNPSSASKSKSSSSSSNKSKPEIASGSRARKSSFTSRMRDRQARNKDPYQSSEESEDEIILGGRDKMRDAPPSVRYGNESYETVQARREAAIILDSPELLMMHAQARSDSIPSTRLHFTKMLAGLDDENDAFPLPAKAPVDNYKPKPPKARKIAK